MADDVTPTFLESLGEELRGNEALQGFESADQLAQAHLDLLGNQPEPREAPENYELTPPEGSKEAYPVVGEFAKLAKEMGLTQAEFSQFNTFTNKILDDAFKSQKAAKEKFAVESKTALIQELGSEEAYNQASELSQRVGLKFFGEEGLKAINSALGEGNPLLVKGLAAVGKVLSDDILETGGGSGVQKELSPSEAMGWDKLGKK